MGSFHFRVIQTRGHSPGHITLHDPTRQVVICGDVALGWGAPRDRARPSTSPYYYNPDLYTQGIETVLALEGALYCTGHFGSLDQAGMQALGDQSLDFVRSLAQWTLDALDAAEPRSLGMIARTVLASLPGYEIGFHLHASAQAHLSKFCREGAGARGHGRRTEALSAGGVRCTRRYGSSSSGEIAILTFNRPDKLNAINRTVYEEMGDYLHSLERG